MNFRTINQITSIQEDVVCIGERCQSSVTQRFGTILENTSDGILLIKWDSGQYETYIRRIDGIYYFIDSDFYRGEKLFDVAVGGGLGNQFFQYVYAMFLKKHGYNDVHFHTTWFSSYNAKREYGLKFYELSDEVKESPIIFTLICQYCDYENALNSLGIVFPRVYNRRLAGYWQNGGYAIDNIEAVRKAFTLKKEYQSEQLSEKIQKIKNQNNTVSIHIRRTDYLNLDNIFIQLGKEYYEKAVDVIFSLCSSNRLNLYVFSDDIDWCEKSVSFSKDKVESINFVHTDSDKPYEDIELMRNCKHNIIANSSFSWMGALLNDNKNKIVVAPEKWITEKATDPSGIQLKFDCDGNLIKI